MKNTSILILTLLASCASDLPRAEQPWRLGLEANATYQASNDVQIPNDGSGTRYGLDDLTGSGPFAAGRTTLEVDLDGRNSLRFLAAPLRTQGTGTFDDPVDFAGESYAADTDTLARYRFDTYRATWRWLMSSDDSFRWYLGGTLLVRDAEVELEQGGVTSRDDNVGLVPLLHVAAEQRLGGPWLLAGDLDAAVAPQGRAIDLGLGLRYEVDDSWDVTLGYRLLDGGADNDTVYSFATFHSLTLALGWSF